MNILIYNWCPVGSVEGGGVALYIRNIITELQKQHDVTFLNSGYYYDKLQSAYIRKSFGKFIFNGIPSYDLVNSPVFAPMKSPADNIESFLKDTSITPLFEKFLIDHDIDVVHFNNFEGLPLDVLNVKRKGRPFSSFI